MSSGPYYDDLTRGQVFDTAPGLTLTEGHAAVHQAIVGDRLRLALDAELSQRVLGGRLAHPGLVCDVAIGQSTLVTQRVIANLFYRGLVFRRAPLVGDTLRTTTEVVALRDSASKPVGLAALRIRTVDQEGREVLDFHRCAMLPLRDEASRPGHADDLGAISAELPDAELGASVAGWDLSALGGERRHAGERIVVEGGDVVSGAPELARLTVNIAAAHHDAGVTRDGRRLVYGGHTIGLAFSQLCRALPDLVTVVAWRSCDHLAPVHEGDVLHSTVTVEALNGTLVELRVLTEAQEPVLDWRLVGVLA